CIRCRKRSAKITRSNVDSAPPECSWQLSISYAGVATTSMSTRFASNSTEIFVGVRATTTSSKPLQREPKQWPRVAHDRPLNNIKNSGRNRHERDGYRRGGAPKRRSPLYHRQGSIHR